MPRKSKEPTKPVRVRADLADKIDLISARVHLPIAEFLDPLLRDVIEQKYREVVTEMASELGDGNGHRKKK